VGQAVGGVHIAVNSEVAALAGGYDVGRVKADWVTVAKVRDGEYNLSVGVVRGKVVAFDAAPGARGVLVQVTLAGAFAASLGAGEANPA
jgi:hypothetical protein